MASRIHPTALVDPAAELGADVELGPYAVVEAGARLGRGVRLWAQAYVCAGAELGDECQVHMGAVVGHLPQDRAYKGEPTRATIGPRTIVRENVTIHRSTGEGTETRVGADCFLMAGSHVAHNCMLGDRVMLANGAQLAGHVQIGNGAIVSGNVVIHQFVRVGRLAILSGGSRFGMDVPPYLIGDGTNAVTSLNSVGLRRSPDLTPQDRSQLKEAYRVLYRSELDLPQALERLRAEFDAPAVRLWVEFLSNPSPRGFCRHKPSRRHGSE
ncbi:MAG: acyl-ACP--UDP-N-acetylglucosamine O-acyltransferase [Planctomycetota bacterium]|nr:acyl-ACP--UDP-N-acetylglucosamine O-acyltransferase [Planctomycetota bacterium]